jgi:hypothetical protein
VQLHLWRVFVKAARKHGDRSIHASL